MSSQKRLVWMDALKGIGILSIMRVHMLGPMEYIQSLIYVGAVAMFFIVAGFNFKFSDSVVEDIKKKAKRLLIPYFIYSILLLVIEHRFNINTLTQAIGIIYARMQLLTCQSPENISFLTIGNAPMWFLPCMFLSYLWTYYFYIKQKTRKRKIVVLVVFFALSTILTFSPIMLPWSIDTSFLLAILLIIGYKCRKHFLCTNIRICLITLPLWLLLLHLCGGSNISIGIYGSMGALSIIPFVFIAIAETYTLAAIFQKVENTYFTKALAYLGRNSLRLMCIHLVIYYKVYGIIHPSVESLQYSKYIILAASFSAIIICNAVIQKFIDKLGNRYIIIKYL